MKELTMWLLVGEVIDLGFNFLKFKFFSSEIKSEFSIVNGIKTHYYHAGNNPFSKIFILHGLGGNSKVYFRLIKILAKKNEVFALNFPSFGKTQALSKPWTTDDFSKFVISFIRLHKSSFEKVKLLGHSAGGLIAIDVAYKYGKELSKLILVDSAGLQKSLDFNYVFKLTFLNPLNHYIESKKNSKLSIFKNVLRVVWFDIKRDFRENFNRLKTIISSWSETCESKLSKISVKTIILWGKKDELFPIEEAKFFNYRIKSSKLYLVDGYHNWIVFNPEIAKSILKKI